MKKSKSFTQYSGDGFAIKIYINTNGTFISRSKLALYGENGKQYRINNKEKLKLRSKQYYIEHKEKLNLYHKQYRKSNREKLKLKHKKYNIKYKEKLKLQSKQYNIEHKEELDLYNKQYRDTHKKERKRYRKDNPEKSRKYKYKRRGWGTPQPINNWFENSHLHHLHLNRDHQICIYIPEVLHKSVWHAYNKPETMFKINRKALEWLATQDMI